MSLKRLLCLILILSSVIRCFAQSSNKETSIQAIKELKHGVLVVIIPSYYKKIKAMEKIVRNPKTKTSTKKRNKKLIQSAQEEQKRLDYKIQKGFIEKYDFSELAFIHDTATVYLIKKGIKKGVFLNDENQTDLTDKSIFFLRYGHTDRATTTGIESWIVTDDQLHDLQKPFPYYVAVFQPIKVVISSLFAPVINIPLIATGRNKKGIGRTINEEFWMYYRLYH